MRYEIDNAMLKSLLPSVVRAEDMLARVDERAARSAVGEGFAERGHFFDAAGALWVSGELVHVEDLVLHDAHMDSRTPSHELTIAHAVLRARRRIWTADPAWPLSAAGLNVLAGAGLDEGSALEIKSRAVVAEDEDDPDELLSAELAEIDAVLARSQRLLDAHLGKEVAVEEKPKEKQSEDPLGLFGDDEWDEGLRLKDWRAVLPLAAELPPALGGVVLFEAWERIEPLRRQSWLGGLLVSSHLRQSAKVTSHLFSFYTGLKTVRHERRRSRDRLTRLLAFLEAVSESAAIGLKEMDRLTLAQTQMALRFKDRRSNSSLPQLADFVLSRPMVSSAMVAKQLKVTSRGALNLLNEIGIREISGRGRYRAWGII
jgi:hypothetical protein